MPQPWSRLGQATGQISGQTLVKPSARWRSNTGQTCCIARRAGQPLIFKVTSAASATDTYHQSTAQVPVSFTDGTCADVSTNAKCALDGGLTFGVLTTGCLTLGVDPLSCFAFESLVLGAWLLALTLKISGGVDLCWQIKGRGSWHME